MLIAWEDFSYEQVAAALAIPPPRVSTASSPVPQPGSKYEMVDTTTGRALYTTTVDHQVTSAVPFRNGIAAAIGESVVTIDAHGKTTPLTHTAGIPRESECHRDGNCTISAAAR
ncbi:MAG TPA: hypothetical protein VF444_25130 [Pseudonocardiaceae bacterium]